MGLGLVSGGVKERQEASPRPLFCESRAVGQYQQVTESNYPPKVKIEAIHCLPLRWTRFLKSALSLDYNRVGVFRTLVVRVAGFRVNIPGDVDGIRPVIVAATGLRWIPWIQMQARFWLPSIRHSWQVVR